MPTLRSPLVVVLVALASCASCAGPRRAQAPQAEAPRSEGSTVTTTGARTERAPGPAAPPAQPRLEVREAEGLPPERVQTIFRPAVEPLKHCLTRSAAGKINLRVTSTDGVLKLRVEPAASLDPTARECALEALTTVYLEQTGSNVGGVSIPPSNFTSMLTLSWW